MQTQKKIKGETEDNLVNQVCTKRNMSSSEVMSVPESFLRQSVSTTVWPAVGEKHFRAGKYRKQGGKESCSYISQGLLYTTQRYTS